MHNNLSVGYQRWWNRRCTERCCWHPRTLCKPFVTICRMWKIWGALNVTNGCIYKEVGTPMHTKQMMVIWVDRNYAEGYFCIKLASTAPSLPGIVAAMLSAEMKWGSMHLGNAIAYAEIVRGQRLKMNMPFAWLVTLGDNPDGTEFSIRHHVRAQRANKFGQHSSLWLSTLPLWQGSGRQTAYWV